MRAKVVEAEAEVPKATAEVFRQGNLGIMDYDRMEHAQADTSMRDAIAGTGEEPPHGGGGLGSLPPLRACGAASCSWRYSVSAEAVSPVWAAVSWIEANVPVVAGGRREHITVSRNL